MARLSPRDEAQLKQYEELLAQQPNALAFAALASLYARKYDFARAVEVLQRGLTFFPNYFSARVLLAKCFIALDRFDVATEELDRILAADPYNTSALGLYGDELRNRGRFAEAREFYQKILEFEPDNEEYAYKLELLDTLTEGGPFAAKGPAAAPAVEVPEAAPVLFPERAVAPARATVTPPPEVKPAAAAPPLAAEEEAEAGVEEAEVSGEELATVTLARIYEDQGLFLRAREVLTKVLAREPANARAQEALAELDLLLAAESSLTGDSIVRLIKKVNVAGGVLGTDELELWEAVTAGVAEALAGFEELTLAQAVAAAAGLRGWDEFIVTSADRPAIWEFDLAGAPAGQAAVGADEMEIDLPLWTGIKLASGVNVAEVAATASLGAAGIEEIALPPMPDDLVLDLKAEVGARKAPPAEKPAAADDLAVKPERYLEKETLTLEKEPFSKEEDFLGWLDSIKLKEL
jgi:tetratricopeptide (TPR) repeat protein